MSLITLTFPRENSMDNRLLANELLAAFGRTLTVEGLKLGEADHSCVLLFDGDLALNIEYDDPAGRLVFSIYLDTLTQDAPKALLRELLAANCYWIDTGGATLCLEEPTGAILLMYASQVTELDEPRLERIVENLLGLAERWRERIAAHADGAQPQPGGAAEAPLPQAGQHLYG
jgi:hypothetical protein